MTQDSNLSQEIKDNTALFHHYNLARVAFGTAQMRQAHQLRGLVALEWKEYDKAVDELKQANQQNPYDLYRLCQAYSAKGDGASAKEFCGKLRALIRCRRFSTLS